MWWRWLLKPKTLAMLTLIGTVVTVVGVSAIDIFRAIHAHYYHPPEFVGSSHRESNALTEAQEHAAQQAIHTGAVLMQKLNEEYKILLRTKRAREEALMSPALHNDYIGDLKLYDARLYKQQKHVEDITQAYKKQFLFVAEFDEKVDLLLQSERITDDLQRQGIDVFLPFINKFVQQVQTYKIDPQKEMKVYINEVFSM